MYAALSAIWVVFDFCPVVYAATRSHGAITPCAARSSTCQLKPPSAIAAAGLAELDLLLWRKPWRGGAVFLCLCRQSARQSSSFCTESCYTHQRLHGFVLSLTPRRRGGSIPGADLTPGLLRFCQQGWCRGERVSGKRAGMMGMHVRQQRQHRQQRGSSVTPPPILSQTADP